MFERLFFSRVCIIGTVPHEIIKLKEQNMKIVKYYIWVLCLCFCGVQVSAQEQEKDTLRQSRELSNDEIREMYRSYRAQADRWKQEVEHNPKDEVAWAGYGNTFWRFYSFFSMWSTEKEKTADEREKNNMFKKVEQYIPNTATQAVLQNIFLTPNESKQETAKEIMDKWPDAVLHYPYYLVNNLFPYDEERIIELCKRWFQSGTFPQQCLNLSYNEMVGTNKDAVIFWNGCYLDGIGCLILQYAKGLFPDKKIVNLYSLMIDSLYQKEIFAELKIPEYQKTGNSFDMKGLLAHTIRHIKRPIYFPTHMSDMLIRDYGLKSKNIYSEGLLLKYSEIPYDNLAVTRRNFEHTYLLDYLYESFYPEKQTEEPYMDAETIKMPELYYVPGFKALLQFYKESGDMTHYDELYSLLESIIKKADYCSEEVRERYLKSINLQ